MGTDRKWFKDGYEYALNEIPNETSTIDDMEVQSNSIDDFDKGMDAAVRNVRKTPEGFKHDN